MGGEWIVGMPDMTDTSPESLQARRSSTKAWTLAPWHGAQRIGSVHWPSPWRMGERQMGNWAAPLVRPQSRGSGCWRGWSSARRCCKLD